MNKPGNLFGDVPANLPNELVTALVERPGLRIERIVSHGHASPPGFWYDQAPYEWVVVLRGAARLRFDDQDEAIDMMPGDFIEIPAGRRHRVEWTTPDEPTIWLAVFHD
jgi:cupin 2 domain-containing protein